MDLPGIFWRNFLTYDFIVFLFALLTAVFFYLCLKRARELYRRMHLLVFVPQKDGLEETQKDRRAIREDEVVLLRKNQNSAYQVFTSFIMIFPLLGILGTVISLLPLVGVLGTDMQANFFSALTSTFWGLVFAILFKALDGWLSGLVTDNEATVALYLRRLDDKAGEGRS